MDTPEVTIPGCRAGTTTVGCDAVGEGVGEAVGLGVGVGVALADGVALTVGDEVGSAVGVAVAVAVGRAVAVGSGVAVGVGSAVGDGVEVAAGVTLAVGVGVACAGHPPAARPSTATAPVSTSATSARRIAVRAMSRDPLAPVVVLVPGSHLIGHSVSARRLGRLAPVIILLVGTGAREHALARALCADPAVSQLHAAPGNPGIGTLSTVDGTPVVLHGVDALDPVAVAALAAAVKADLVVVGPEAPLVAGVADAVRGAGIPVFGPSGRAAMLEGSKAFAKEVMLAADVPTAEPRVCRTSSDLEDALDAFGAPHVVKDDGLAAGKGVVVTGDRAAALAHGEEILDAGGVVVVEDFLDGPEVSLFCLCDGETVVPLQPAQDFKRAYDGDAGPNTGGMGAYSPLPWAPADLVDEVVRTVAQPTVDEMARRGTPFVGVLYCGLALTSKGVRVVEFNARFGDPETQVVLARLATPLAGVLLAAAEGRLGGLAPLEWRDDAAVTVVVAAHGYPAEPRKGDAITGIDAAESVDTVHVLHAGTSLDHRGTLLSNGGRVLSVTARGATLTEARERAYAGVDRIVLEGSHHRRDIAAAAAEGAR